MGSSSSNNFLVLNKNGSKDTCSIESRGRAYLVVEILLQAMTYHGALLQSIVVSEMAESTQRFGYLGPPRSHLGKSQMVPSFQTSFLCVLLIKINQSSINHQSIKLLI
jgi:hypothetical protein